LRKKCLSERRKLKRANRRRGNDPNSTELLNYRESQKALKIEIERSKNKSW
jgi:ribosomal protein L21E